jgi:tryptophan synthase alpha chain
VKGRLQRTFAALRQARATGLVTYVTAGDPNLPATLEILRALDRGGADVIEVGVPFSDPLADGPVIQRASERALRNGTTLGRTLDAIADVRRSVRAPLVVFTYANPIARLGFGPFARRAAQAGVDGVLALDIPMEEAAPLREALEAEEIDTILLLSPTTSDERVRAAAQLGSGFLYAISRLGVTGAREAIPSGARALVARIRACTDMPVALGFGLSRPEHVREVGEFADAAVVGSALVSVIAERSGHAGLLESVEAYVRWLKGQGPPLEAIAS